MSCSLLVLDHRHQRTTACGDLHSPRESSRWVGLGLCVLSLVAVGATIFFDPSHAVAIEEPQSLECVPCVHNVLIFCRGVHKCMLSPNIKGPKRRKVSHLLSIITSHHIAMAWPFDESRGVHTRAID